MAAPIIAVLTQDQELLDRLKKACPGFRFQEGQPSATAQVAIVDREPLRAEVPARIHLVAQPPERRVPGDLYITREKLLAMPEEFLMACMEVVAARDTNQTLKDSLEFATHVQDL